ncbi:MAG TPA: DHH family phosphoesterase, partial [Streptosporangiaceae bacterium]|nr:DHH family phosphoesterase [Streptosporangiaceae bacterium]
MTSKADMDWARAVKIIDSAADVWLACHIRPDADALGSMLAVAQALHARGDCGVVASFGEEPFDVPAILRFLPGLELLAEPSAVPAQPAVMVSFDASSIDRLGLLAGPAAAATELIVLDHHASNAGFGTVNLVDPVVAATAVLSCELIDRLGIPLNASIATDLYAGLATDTGSFKFSSTTPQVHELAARLLRTGIDPGGISRNLYDRAPFSYMGLLAAALQRAKLEPSAARGLGLVWTTITKADREHAGGLPLDAV